MVVQGWPLWELSRAYTWEYCPEKAAWLTDLFDSPEAIAKKADDSPADTDHDGMPNDLESDFGTDPAVFDGFGDPDGDGRSDYMEYVYGTDPADAESVPAPDVYAVPEAYATIQEAIEAAKADGGGKLLIADIDRDGHPEIICGGTVIDHAGEKNGRSTTTDSQACRLPTSTWRGIPRSS